jgi:hypothetical protein
MTLSRVSPDGYFSQHDIFNISPTKIESKINYPTGYNYTKYVTCKN